MNFKYYDVISSLVVGYVLLVIGMYAFQIKYSNDYTVAYLAMAFLCGYITNAVGSLLEPMYYFTIGGKPSTRLLHDGKKKHGRIYNFFVPKNTDNPDNYGGLSIQTFSTSSCDHSNFNNFSIITVFTLSNIKVVVCGDNEKASLDILMMREDFRDAVKNADVLVAPHHGRESAYHSNFVALVNSRITIISDTNKLEASASDKYSKMSRGWTVDGKNRNCITTRNDGNIKVVYGESDDPKNYGLLSISTF